MTITVKSPALAVAALSTLAALALVSTAGADTVVLTQVGGYAGSTGGGEFNAVLNPTPSSLIDLSGYNQSKGTSFADGSFETFCIESQVEFYPGATYNVTTDTQVLPETQGVDAHTAWLYAEFASGSLAGYEYTPGNSRSASADVLQYAIWYFQGESQPYTNGPLQVDPATNAFILAANAAFSADANLADQIGANVRALVLTDGNGNFAQDQLIIVPHAQPQQTVPDGGSTVALLGMSLGCIGALSKKKKATA